MKKGIEKYSAAAIYLIVALFETVMLLPVLSLVGIANLWLSIAIQIAATAWFVKTGIDILDSKKNTVYGTSFFAYNIVYIILTGFCFDAEKQLISSGLEKLNITDVPEKILIIIICIKLVLVAAAALLATTEPKPEEQAKKADADFDIEEAVTEEFEKTEEKEADEATEEKTEE